MATREPVKDIAYIVAALRNKIQSISGNSQALTQKKTLNNINESINSGVSAQKSLTQSFKQLVDAKKKYKEENVNTSSDNENENANNNVVVRPFDATKFIKYVEKEGTKILESYVKRVSISVHEKNIKIVGSNFDIKYFKNKENKDLLFSRIQSYTGSNDWYLQLEENNGKSEASNDSFLAKQAKEAEALVNEKKEKVYNDSLFQEIKKVFPGTEIERFIKK